MCHKMVGWTWHGTGNVEHEVSFLLNWRQKCVFGLAFAALHFSFYVFFLFFFFFHAFSLSQAATVHVRYMNSNRNFWPVLCEQYIRALFMDPQISFFINFFIKNRSHGIIYTFKNYFATVISAISFQFQQNKSYFILFFRVLTHSICF